MLNYVELSTGKIGFRGKNPASNLASLTMDQYSIYSNINDLSGSPDCVLSFADNDVYIGKTSVFDSDDGSDIIPIYKTLSELNSNIKFEFFEQTVTCNGSAKSYTNLGPMNIPEGYALLGFLPIKARVDWWQVSYACGSNNMINAVIYNYFNSSLTDDIKVCAVYAKS